MLAKLKTLQKTVTTAGTRVQLTTVSTPAYGVRIKAKVANAGVIYLGDLAVAAANGYQVAAGEHLDLSEILLDKTAIIDLKDIWVDAATSADGISVVYFQLSNS